MIDSFNWTKLDLFACMVGSLSISLMVSIRQGMVKGKGFVTRANTEYTNKSSISSRDEQRDVLKEQLTHG